MTGDSFNCLYRVKLPAFMLYLSWCPQTKGQGHSRGETAGSIDSKVRTGWSASRNQDINEQPWMGRNSCARRVTVTLYTRAIETLTPTAPQCSLSTPHRHFQSMLMVVVETVDHPPSINPRELTYSQGMCNLQPALPSRSASLPRLIGSST